MKVDFSKEELEFIVESLEYAKLSFDTSVSPHLADQSKYPKSIYEKKKKMFGLILNRLRSSQ